MNPNGPKDLEIILCVTHFCQWLWTVNTFTQDRLTEERKKISCGIFFWCETIWPGFLVTWRKSKLAWENLAQIALHLLESVGLKSISTTHILLLSAHASINFQVLSHFELQYSSSIPLSLAFSQDELTSIMEKNKQPRHRFENLLSSSSRPTSGAAERASSCRYISPRVHGEVLT